MAEHDEAADGANPTVRRSVSDQLFDRLLDDILSGTLAPGVQLPAERELATQSGVNRQAVREALQRLRQMDLVTIVHGGGVRVQDWRATASLALLPLLLVREGRAPEPAVARSIMELRAAVGADAARACAERSAGPTGDALRVLVAQMQAIQSDPQEWGTLGFDFWDAVVIGGDNVAYRLAFNTLRAVADAVEPLMPGVLGAEWMLFENYRTVAQAIAAGDGDAAAAAARELLDVGVAALNAFLATNDPPVTPVGS